MVKRIRFFLEKPEKKYLEKGEAFLKVKLNPIEKKSQNLRPHTTVPQLQIRNEKRGGGGKLLVHYGDKLSSIGVAISKKKKK